MKKMYLAPQVTVFTVLAEDIVTGSPFGEDMQEDIFSFEE